MEYLAEELGVEVLKLPALQRDLSPRADARQSGRCAPSYAHADPTSFTPIRRRPARPEGWPQSSPGVPGPRAVVHTFHGHVLSGYFSPTTRTHLPGRRAVPRPNDGSARCRERRGARRPCPLRRRTMQRSIEVVPYGFDLPPWTEADDASRARRPVRAGDRRGHVRRRLGGKAHRDQATSRPRPHAARRCSTSASTHSSSSSGTVTTGRRSKRSSRELGVSDRCRLVGFQRRMRDWYAAFDASLLTSANEGTPVVAIESLAAERPVVATRAGGTATVVRDGETGFLESIGDTDALARPARRARPRPRAARRLGPSRRARTCGSVSRTARMADELDAVYREDARR